MKTNENRVRIGQRWDPELLRAAQKAADELGQTLTTFTERALAAHLATLEARAQQQQQPAQSGNEVVPTPAPRRSGAKRGREAARA